MNTTSSLSLSISQDYPRNLVIFSGFNLLPAFLNSLWSQRPLFYVRDTALMAESGSSQPVFHLLVLCVSRFAQGGSAFLRGGPRPPPSDWAHLFSPTLLFLPSESLTPDQPWPEFLAATAHVFLGKPIILSLRDASDALWSVKTLPWWNRVSL